MKDDESELDAKFIDSPEKFGDWIESNRDRLLIILHQKISQKLRTKVDSEDILQDAVSRAVKNLATMNLAEREMMPWFMQVLNNTIIDIHRYHFGSLKRDAAREFSVDADLQGQRDEPGKLAELLVASITSPSQAFSQHVRLDRMQEALSQLPSEARQAIHWRFMESLSSQEIAIRLNKSDGAIRVLLTRTIKKLEELLADVRP